MTVAEDGGPRRIRFERWKKPVRLTPLYHWHVGANATMAEHAGWMVPTAYRDVSDELRTISTSAGLLDIGDTGKIDVRSTEMDSMLARTFPEGVMPPVGRAVPAGVDARVCRLTSGQVLIVTAATQLSRVLDRVILSTQGSGGTHVTDITGGLCGLRLLGPAAPDVLERLTSLDLAPNRFANDALAQGMLAHIRTLVVRRDAAGLPGYDIFAERDLGAYLWDTILHVGTRLGLLPVGRNAAEAIG